MRGRLFVCLSSMLGKVSPANVMPLILSSSALNTNRKPHLELQERIVQSVETQKVWVLGPSCIQSGLCPMIGFLWRKRKIVGKLPGRHLWESLESIPTKVSRVFFWRSLHGDTQGGRTDRGAEVLPFVKRKCRATRGWKEKSYQGNGRLEERENGQKMPVLAKRLQTSISFFRVRDWEASVRCTIQWQPPFRPRPLVSKGCSCSVLVWFLLYSFFTLVC